MALTEHNMHDDDWWALFFNNYLTDPERFVEEAEGCRGTVKTWGSRNPLAALAGI